MLQNAQYSIWFRTPASMFGVDNVGITLSGNSTPTTASWFGTAKQALGMILQATLRGV
jgi:hypothetical protein